MEDKKIQRWIVLIAGIVIQTAIGGLYAWSTFVPALVDEHGLSRSETGLLFGVMILVFTAVTIPAGALLQKKGPRFTASLGAVFFGAGYVGASFAADSFPLLLLYLGGVTGTGIGLVYVCPLTTGMHWFPNNRGLVTGAAVAGFGIGAIILSTVAEYLMNSQSLSVLEVFRFTGFVFGGVAFLASLFLAVPKVHIARNIERSKTSVTKHLLSKPFILIALGMFSGTFAGLLISAHLKPLMLSQGASESQAVLTITLFAIGNSFGRLTWGAIHDRVGGRKTILYSLGTLIVAVASMAMVSTWGTSTALLPLILVVGFGFGACFVVFASAVTDQFGVELLPRLYPVSFLGYGVAALIGPTVGGSLYDATGSYQSALLLSVGVLVLAVLLIFIQYNETKPV